MKPKLEIGDEVHYEGLGVQKIVGIYYSGEKIPSELKFSYFAIAPCNLYILDGEDGLGWDEWETTERKAKKIELQIDLSRYPNKCDNCGSAAYYGFDSFDCSNNNCITKKS